MSITIHSNAAYFTLFPEEEGWAYGVAATNSPLTDSIPFNDMTANTKYSGASINDLNRETLRQYCGVILLRYRGNLAGVILNADGRLDTNIVRVIANAPGNVLVYSYMIGTGDVGASSAPREIDATITISHDGTTTPTVS